MTQSQQQPNPEMPAIDSTLLYTDPAQLDQDVTVLIRLAEQMAECGQIEQAEQIANMVLAICENSDAYNLLGVAAYVRGESKLAVEQFSKSLELAPDNLDAAKNLIETLDRTGNGEDSRKLAAQQLARHPGDHELMRLASLSAPQQTLRQAG